MTKTTATESAIQMHNRYGGIWHVVQIGRGFYDVSQHWMDLPYNNEVSLFSVGTIDSFPGGKLSVAGKIITKFNKFLLWLFKPLLNARGNKSKT